MFLPGLYLAFAIAASVPPAGGPREASRGAALLRGCQAEVRLMGRDTLDDAPPLDLINGAYCIGYLNGFTAGLPSASTSICTQNDSMGELVRAYVRYMDHNPQLLDEDKRIGLRLALEQAYPCPAPPL